MQKITAIIVDDEPQACDFLADLLNQTNEIEVLAKAIDVDTGIKTIIEQKPDIIFLDIDMPEKNGFTLINEINELKIDTTIIFTTAHRQYAIEAFDKAAFGYLLKPLEADKLQKLINRYKIEKRKPANNSTKHKLRTFKGFVLIDEKEVMGCKADGNYTHIFLQNGKTENVIVQIGEIEKMFGSDSFFRSHRSALVNTRFIHAFTRETNKLYLMSEIVTLEFPVAREKIKELEGLI
jgi:two-component system LytT family response regulator